jgi:hypothetical protein
MEEELQYIVTFDAHGNPLEGGKNYKFYLPPNIPARDFWSIIVYDYLTRLIVHTEQKWPSVFCNSKTLIINHNGSVNVWFGPEPPVGIISNWIQTIPGKHWLMILRLYGPGEAWFDKTWRPGKMEEVKQLVEI